MEAIKILSGNRESISRSLTVIDLWENRVRQVNVAKLKEQIDCPCCNHRDFSWLEGQRVSQSAVLCGRNAVQLSPAPGTVISLDSFSEKLATVGKVSRNKYLLRLTVDKYLITLFPDGRAIIGGTDDIAEARTVYARYIGA
jgi:adenylyltransferase/sulfurtransferase